jgi:hypothetical protein
MKKSLPHIQYSRLFSLYQKLYARLNKHFSTGRFKQFGKAQQYKLLNRIERLRVQLSRMEQGLKLGGLALALGTAVSIQQANAQATLEFEVNTYATGVQGFPSTAIDSQGDFVISWQSNGEDGGSYGIYAQLYNKAGVKVGSEFRVNTYTTLAQKSSSVAMDSEGDFVISWQSQGQDGDSYGIYAQRYDKTGAKVSSEFQVNTYTTSNQSNPSVAMDATGDFVISWASYGQDGSNYGIYAQRYDNTGAKVGIEFQVNTYTTNYQRSPSAAMNASGDFVISWESYGQDGSKFGVYAQRYDDTGAKVGSEFQVNTYTTDNQGSSSAAMDAVGDFVIAWTSTGEEGVPSQFGIYAQRYDETGAKVGSEFHVNTYTKNNQANSCVAMDSDGDFMITWWSSGQDGSYTGVYAQRYKSTGIQVGGEFQANTYTTNHQDYPSVAMDAAGDFVIAWQSSGEDGSSFGIFGQRYFNQSPVINSQNFSISENSVNGVVVGTVAASNPDPGQLLTYSITAGNTGNMFTINTYTGIITLAGMLSYATTPTYTLTVQATDNGIPLVQNASAVITIHVTSVTTGILSGTNNVALVLYPNPAKTDVYMNLEGVTQVRLMDLSGKVVKDVSTNNSSFSVAGVSPGIYMVELTQNGEKAMSKLVIE